MVRLISQSHALCIETFQQLCKAATDSDFQLAVLDEFDKYKIWSGNLGASHSGRTYKLSLDYRLREATFYKDQVMSIIDTLRKHVSTPKECDKDEASTKADYAQVENARQIVSGEREPFEDFSESESDQDSVDSLASNHEPYNKGYDSPWESSSESDYVPKLEPSKDGSSAPNDTSGLLPQATELAQILEAIKLTVRSLYKLPIRKPAPVDRLKGRLTDAVSCFQPFDCMYVRDKFPNLSFEVANRIANHITRRRQLLLYRQEHQELLRAKELQNEPSNAPTSTGSQIEIEQHPLKMGAEPSLAQLYPATASQPESKPQTFRSKATTFIRDEEQLPQSSFLYASSVGESISKTSMAASQITQETPIEVPPRPKDLEGTSKTMFECKFCALTIHIRSDKAWKKHVLSDLQPYICTFPQCDLGDHMFANRDAWFQHEIQTHRVEYYCNTEAHWTYRNLSEFMDHMQREHDISLADLVKPKAMNMFKHPVSSSEGICNLCFREQPVRNMKSHVSKHLEQVSLFAIPRAEYGEDDVDTGENQSHQAQHNLEESIAHDDEEESISQDDEQESISQDHEEESNSQDDEEELISQGHKQENLSGPLHQHAAQFQGGVLEAHAEAFNAPAVHHRSAQPRHSQHHNHDNPESTSISNATVNRHIGLPDPPPSSGSHPSPKQPHHASPPDSSSYFCCGKLYASKHSFMRHRRESRTCPHGSGGRSFICYICANTDQPFSRRSSLKKHVQEVHRQSPEEANMEVDTWYGRYGESKDYPDAVIDLDKPY